eukprot:1149458-Pelagomonas_calceolata.AAC.2
MHAEGRAAREHASAYRCLKKQMQVCLEPFGRRGRDEEEGGILQVAEQMKQDTTGAHMKKEMAGAHMKK